MEGENQEAQSLAGAARPISTVERRAHQALVLPAPVQREPTITSPSTYVPSSSPPLPGSAVSALQCKFEEMSQRKCKGKGKPDQFLKVPSEHFVQKQREKGQPSASRIPPMGRRKKSIAIDPEGSEPQFQVHTFLTGPQKEAYGKQGEEESTLWVVSLPHGLREGSSLEDMVKGGTAPSHPPKPASFPRHWAPPRGIRGLARPETRVLDGQDAPSLTLENVPHTCEGEFWRRQKFRVGGVAVHKELQRSDSLERALYKSPKETSIGKAQDRLWLEDSWETLSTQAGPEKERAEVDQKCIENKPSAVKTMRAACTEVWLPQETIYRGLPPSYKDADWETADSTIGPELTLRTAANPADSVLSLRHEQAKSLLERARRKARIQNPVTRSADIKKLEVLPSYDSPAAHRHTLVAPPERLAPPAFQLETHGSTSVHVEFMQRRGQSPTHVRFEDESEKEAVWRYLDRARERSPGVAGRSQISQQPKADILAVWHASQGIGADCAGGKIPVATLTSKKAGPSLETMSTQENLTRCGTCGTILAAGPAKDPSSKDPVGGCAQGQGKTAPRRVAAGHLSRLIICPGILGGVTLTGGCSLAGSMDPAGVGVAGERVSAFGKLRRRSRKGESRVEMTDRPYIRCQELLAQRRSSRTRSSLEDVIGPLSKQMESPVRVTFALDTSQEPLQPRAGTSRNSPGLQLPIKSALKSGSKNRQAGLQLIGGSPGTASQVSEIPSAIWMRPDPLKYSSPVLSPEPQGPAIWEAVDPLDGEEGCSGAPHCPMRRGVAMSKAEDLRAELLRAEHRKAEFPWDDKSAEREVKPRLSLRRFFSAMGLNSVGELVKGARSSSMDYLSSSPSKHGSASPRHASPSHTPFSLTPKGHLKLQRTPSLQHLHTGSSLTQLRKATSVQSLLSPKRKWESSTMLGELPVPPGLGPRGNNREVGAELLDGSRGGAPVGRLLQVLPDGTLLLELTRPANRPFGFVISRAKGHPDPGIYVEQVGSSPAENIYTGLLSVGDEILEVNGEKVSGMSIDLLTRVLSRECTTTIRTAPHHWIQH